ncbi:hypothetical protein STEG23_027567 [Scotinomys teguina]
MSLGYVNHHKKNLSMERLQLIVRDQLFLGMDPPCGVVEVVDIPNIPVGKTDFTFLISLPQPLVAADLVSSPNTFFHPIHGLKSLFGGPSLFHIPSPSDPLLLHFLQKKAGFPDFIKQFIHILFKVLKHTHIYYFEILVLCFREDGIQSWNFVHVSQVFSRDVSFLHRK